MILMDKFEICFQVKAGAPDGPFQSQRTIIPAYVPLKPIITPENKWDPEVMKFNVSWSEHLDYGEIMIERILQFNMVPLELVTRFFVSVGKRAKESLIWKDHIIIFLRDFKPVDGRFTANNQRTKALLRVDDQLNQFVIKLRGFDRQGCVELMGELIKEVEAICLIYPGLKWSQYVRSPHHRHAFISFDELKLALPAKEVLFCPKTSLPIHVKTLLYQVGHRDQPKDLVLKGILSVCSFLFLFLCLFVSV